MALQRSYLPATLAVAASSALAVAAAYRHFLAGTSIVEIPAEAIAETKVADRQIAIAPATRVSSEPLHPLAHPITDATPHVRGRFPCAVGAIS